jgi:hypothetical protein
MKCYHAVLKEHRIAGSLKTAKKLQLYNWDSALQDKSVVHASGRVCRRSMLKCFRKLRAYNWHQPGCRSSQNVMIHVHVDCHARSPITTFLQSHMAVFGERAMIMHTAHTIGARRLILVLIPWEIVFHDRSHQDLLLNFSFCDELDN